MNSDLVLPAAVFSLCVRVLRLCPVLTAVYRFSNITTQITFWEIIVIQFVCSSEKLIVCLEQKLSASESDLCQIKQGISLSDDAVTTAGKKIFVCPIDWSVHPVKSMNM